MSGDDFERLEAIFRGEFEDAYVERNKDAPNHRRPFWDALLTRTPVASALEVGCGVGPNLRWVVEHVPPRRVCGADINQRALVELGRSLPEVAAVRARARELPFTDGSFELVFTAGVLMHQTAATLTPVVRELARVSSRYLLACEYGHPDEAEIPYRGMSQVLFKRDYAAAFARIVPELQLAGTGHLSRAEGWDDVTWWLLERR